MMKVIYDILPNDKKTKINDKKNLKFVFILL